MESKTGSEADTDRWGADKKAKDTPIPTTMRLVSLINDQNKISMSYEQKGKLAKLIEEKLGSNFLTGEL